MADLSLEAEIDLLPTDRGGRRGPVGTGFRPALWFGETGPGGEPELHSVILCLKRGSEVAPGGHGEVLLSPLAYEAWPQVKPGTHFDVYDAGRHVGTGLLHTAPTPSAAEPELRKALTDALEEWVVERFGERVTRRPRLGGRLEPDLIAWFNDDEGKRHGLVAEVVARKPRKEDVDRLARMMQLHGASLGVVVALHEPTAATLDAIYRHGTVALSRDLWVPRIRVVTTRDLARDNVQLLPSKRQPEALELLAA
jgi:hypothetical protein